MTFKEYVMSRPLPPVTGTPYGDFIRDAQGDPDFPDTIQSLADLEIEFGGVSAGAKHAARELWRQYQNLPPTTASKP